jgi:CxxC-x17-CxxC domain-containing protein
MTDSILYVEDMVKELRICYDLVRDEFKNYDLSPEQLQKFAVTIWLNRQNLTTPKLGYLRDGQVYNVEWHKEPEFETADKIEKKGNEKGIGTLIAEENASKEFKKDLKESRDSYDENFVQGTDGKWQGLCDNCGTETSVPFRPYAKSWRQKANKPIQCPSCYKK